MGEWVLVCWLMVGGMGDQNGPSIFLIFRYIDDQDVLILPFGLQSCLKALDRMVSDFQVKNSNIIIDLSQLEKKEE